MRPTGLAASACPYRRRLDRRRAGRRARLLPRRRPDDPFAGRLSRHRHLRRRGRGPACDAQPPGRHGRAFRHRLHPAPLWANSPVRRSPSRCSISASWRWSCSASISRWKGWCAAPGAACCAPSARTRRRRSALGKSALSFRLQAFTIGGAIMALAGAVQGHFIGFIAPDNYQPMLTFQVWAMLIVGGSGNNRGAILGAVLVWGIWAGSAGLVAALFPPDQQARAGGAADRHDRRRPLRHPARPPARHHRRIAHRLAPSRPGCRPTQSSQGTGPCKDALIARPSPGGLDISRLVCGLWQVADLEKDGTTLDPETAAGCARSLCAGRLRYVRHGRPLWQRRDHHGPAARPICGHGQPSRRDDQMVPGARRDDGRCRARRRHRQADAARRREGRSLAVPLVELRASGLAGRAARDDAAARRGPDRGHRRHQFRRGASGAGAGRRRTHRHQQGLLLARRPPRRRPPLRALRREGREALRLRHALRRLPLRKVARQAGADFHPGLEPLEIQALHRHGRRLERASRASFPRRRHSPASTASRSPTSPRAGCSNIRRSPRRSSAPAFPRASTGRTTSTSSPFALDAEDHALLDEAFAATTPIPGDCGDEYRRPPFLTASGDLSHHLDAMPSVFTATPDPKRPDRSRVSSGSIWEPLAGFSRAGGVKDTIRVSAPPRPTDATAAWRRATRARRRPTYSTRSRPPSPPSADRWKTSCARASICGTSASGSRSRARMAASSATSGPANTLIQAGDLVGDYEVEIEAEAVVRISRAARHAPAPPSVRHARPGTPA